jgi:nucleotide-binding universal stress UspA family protein
MSDQARPDDWDLPIVMPPIPAPSRILVPFDGSHTAERALAWASMVAAGSQAEVIVLVGYETPLTKKGRGSTYVESVRNELQEEAHELAEEAAALLLAGGIAARAIVARGEPAAAVLEIAADEHVDLIVLGRRGLTSELGGVQGTVERLRSGLSGGVAERVMRAAESPVLVVG